MTCPGCEGPISAGAVVCKQCRPRAYKLGVQMLLRRITSVQIRVFHAKANDLDKITGHPFGTAKEQTLKRLGLSSVKQLSEDEAEDVLQELDVEIKQHRDRARAADVADELEEVV